MKELQEKFFYELTNPQKSILLSEKFYGNRHIYVIPGWACIKGNIDFDLLSTAINTVVKNNEVLRTRFIKCGDKTCQYFENYVPFEVQKIVVNDIAELEDFIKGLTFDIYAETPAKFLIFENLSGYSGFCCILHHLIGDAWSFALFLEETFKAYQNLMYPESSLPLRVTTYKDFIYSEEEYLKSDKFKKDKEYWENNFKAQVEIQSFKPNSNFFDTDAKRASFLVPKNISNYCNENKISLFSVFYAALSLYFSRINNLNEIVIGTPILNRTNFLEKNSLGMFISTLPFKTNLDFSENFWDFVKNISIKQLGILRHQRYPYENLQKYYTKKFGRNTNLYDILFSYQNARTKHDNLKFEFESKWVFTEHQIESLAINVSNIDDSDSLNIDYDFLTSIFSSDDIKSIHERIVFMINQCINNKNILLKDIDIVTEIEKKILIEDFNKTDAKYDKEETIATLFSKQAKITPNNIAVSFTHMNMTYKELDEKSNYLCKILKEKGVSRNTFVGIILNRSLEMIISILAVLKAGAAYMPINPEYPDERIDYMISDSNCKLLITKENYLYNNKNVQKVFIDISKLESESNFENISQGDDLAYVIYTSGSTGKPKGVMIRHFSIVNTLLWRKNTYHFDDTIRVLQIPSFAFDSSVEDIFTPLISGSKLILIYQANSKFDIATIRELIETHHANHMLVVPSFYNVLLNEMPDVLGNMKFVTVAGEGFSMELVKKHFSKLENVELYNEYGPTENSVCTTFHKLTLDDDKVYIGKPINNCKCYILDANLKLQPFNTKGELYVSGPGLAKGYIGRNDLNETRFIKNPFQENSLMYKTGDVVSIDENGIMTFHERVDYQVKYNGFRINLGEIENSISLYIKNPNVVTLLKKDNNVTSLVSYIETNKEIDITDLKQNLKKFLPYYMIPKEIYEVKHFPTTPNGKVDRKKLAEMDFEAKDKTIIAPRNNVDAIILAAWKQVLKQENISIDDNIFDIGGDSLSIISIQSVLFKNNIKVKSQYLFEHQTIREITDCLKDETSIYKKSDDSLYAPKDTNISDVLTKVSAPKNVLLTGVTGFLGSHILSELLTKFSDIKIYCTIRKKPNRNCYDRLKEILHYYFGEKYDLLIDDKIIPIQGDMARENLGIDITTYKSLTLEIDTVINCASKVKHFGDYNSFYNSNVMSVKNIIKFAKESGASINHMSTTSISGNYLVRNNITYDFSENDFFIGQNYKENVYVRTKFEAENEMFKAQNEGIDVNVFRIGNIMPRISDGKFQINKFDNAYFKRIYGFTKLKRLPINLVNQMLEFTPVDACARAIVSLMVYKNKVFHIQNSNLISIEKLINGLKKYNINIEFISEKEFSDFLHSEAGIAYLSNFITDLNNSDNLNYDSKIKINDDITKFYLKNNGFEWPCITEDYIKLFIKDILED